MLERMEIYLHGKGLELNREKTKVIRFKRGGRENGQSKLEMEREGNRGDEGD